MSSWIEQENPKDYNLIVISSFYNISSVIKFQSLLRLVWFTLTITSSLNNGSSHLTVLLSTLPPELAFKITGTVAILHFAEISQDFVHRMHLYQLLLDLILSILHSVTSLIVIYTLSRVNYAPGLMWSHVLFRKPRLLLHLVVSCRFQLIKTFHVRVCICMCTHVG